MKEDKPRILIVDDEKINLKALADLLQDEYTVVLAKSGKEGLQRAREEPQPDLILLDVLMPDMGGFEVIRHLKHDDRTNQIPVIFITALSSAQEEEKGLRLGAVDYITKPFSHPIVKMRIHNYLQMMHKYRLLEQRANLDALTEIPNRGSFEETLEKEWKRATRNQSPLSVAMLDIDFFKQFNDLYGHLAGDEALQKVAGALQKTLQRPADLAARYGGEEFVLLLPETSGESALIVSERVRTEVHDLNIPHSRSRVANYLTVSIGVASMPGYSDTGPETLLDKADKNMYQAKEAGRNRVVGD